MSYSERPHPHQSDVLDFLPKSYIPFKKSKEGVRTFGVIAVEQEKLVIRYQHDLPKWGGYIASDENIFGSPTYCPNATRHHKNHMEKYGSMPHLVFFDSEKAAKKSGFRKCKVCTKKK